VNAGPCKLRCRPLLPLLRFYRAQVPAADGHPAGRRQGRGVKLAVAMALVAQGAVERICFLAVERICFLAVERICFLLVDGLLGHLNMAVGHFGSSFFSVFLKFCNPT